MEGHETISDLKIKHPEKFVSLEKVFSNIHRGDRIFIGTACGEPQFLVRSLIEYVENHPKAFFDTEIFHIWTLGVAPYAQEKFKSNFRHNSFFIGNDTRESINKGVADYTPIHLSQIPALFEKNLVNVDVALVQTSMPDKQGFMSLGVSVDITKTAVEKARTVIVQINPEMPRVHGDTFINIKDVDFAVYHQEDLLTFGESISDDISQKIGSYVSRIISDGDTIQVGYGSIPNAILKNLDKKKHLGVHTELLSDGIVDLINKGIIDNSKKTVNRGKTVATFSMGSKPTYQFLDDNPAVEFRPLDYTNNPLVIARIKNMTAINSALQIDLTGQSSAESIGRMFYSGIGGQADFMRGAVLAPGGKTILVIQSTAENGGVSRIVPFLSEGAGVTLTRGDIHYVVSEYGIAYIHGKNIRERAMSLISIAHPKFRPWLIQEARKFNLIYKDQAYVPGKKGEYPEDLETYRTTECGFTIKLRPVKIDDEPLVKDLFYSLSEDSMYKRFISTRLDMPHERRQEYVAIDYTQEMVILAVLDHSDHEEIVGIGQYGIGLDSHTAEVAFAISDNFHNKGVGTELLKYLTLLAKRQGLLGFTAEVLRNNRSMLHLFKKQFPDLDQRIMDEVYELRMPF